MTRLFLPNKSPLVTVLFSLFSTLKVNGQDINFPGKCTVTGEKLRCTGEGTTNWPDVDFSLIFNVPVSVTVLEFDSYYLGLTFPDFLPLPELPSHITRIRFINIVTEDDIGNQRRFPLRGLMASIKRELIEQLDLASLFMVRLEKVDFEGFSGLKRLDLDRCQLNTIASDSFDHFGKEVSSENGLTKRFVSSFSELSIEDKQLKSFPWESLQRFHQTFQAISFASSLNLEAITVPANTVLLPMESLLVVIITGTKIPTLPRKFLDTFVSSTTEKSILHFTENANLCGSCELVPMIEWARAGTDEKNRELTVTCAYRIEGNKPDSISHEKETEGDSAFWREYSYEECKTTGIIEIRTTIGTTGPTIGSTTPDAAATKGSTTPSGATSAHRFTLFQSSIAVYCFWIVMCFTFLSSSVH